MSRVRVSGVSVRDYVGVSELSRGYGGGDDGGGEGDGQMQSQKQEPHTEMWGIRVCIVVIRPF